MNTQEKRVTQKVGTLRLLTKERAAPPAVVDSAAPVQYSQTVLFRPASQLDLSKQQKRENDARILHVAHS